MRLILITNFVSFRSEWLPSVQIRVFSNSVAVNQSVNQNSQGNLNYANWKSVPRRGTRENAERHRPNPHVCTVNIALPAYQFWESSAFDAVLGYVCVLYARIDQILLYDLCKSRHRTRTISFVCGVPLSLGVF